MPMPRAVGRGRNRVSPSSRRAGPSVRRRGAVAARPRSRTPVRIFRGPAARHGGDGVQHVLSYPCCDSCRFRYTILRRLERPSGGVLGVLPGIVGCIQAMETIKLIVARGQTLIGRLVVFDALSMKFRELKLRKDP